MQTPFDLTHAPPIGMAETLAPGLQVVTAPNASPMTFTGTRSYILGDDDVALIDPGPLDAAHETALLAALGGRRVGHILVTHAHVDHSPLAQRLSQRLDAPVLGFGPAHAGRSPLMAQLASAAELGGAEGIDAGFTQHKTLADGDIIAGAGWALRAVHTPGHLSNHLCFAWDDARALFSGDHVMGWASTLISPPDGDLAAFMQSLERLESMPGYRYFPGHGAPVTDGLAIARHLAAHRRNRADQILTALAAHPATPAELVARIYTDIPPALHGAAARNVLAHLLDELAKGRIAHRGALKSDAVFFIQSQHFSK
ncbi:MBL fold metallo-hydrolase [Abyssibius alkaniclasticus]|uniref:MBL fold metallo-hydrolase n=1 Tax=Abyssibius alkaniclasticus TaxID=2881234 RepID=UPI004058858E